MQHRGALWADWAAGSSGPGDPAPTQPRRCPRCACLPALRPRAPHLQEASLCDPQRWALRQHSAKHVGVVHGRIQSGHACRAGGQTGRALMPSRRASRSPAWGQALSRQEREQCPRPSSQQSSRLWHPPRAHTRKRAASKGHLGGVCGRVELLLHQRHQLLLGGVLKETAGVTPLFNAGQAGRPAGQPAHDASCRQAAHAYAPCTASAPAQGRPPSSRAHQHGRLAVRLQGRAPPAPRGACTPRSRRRASARHRRGSRPGRCLQGGGGRGEGHGNGNKR